MVGWVLDTGPPESNRQMQTSRCALILNPVLNFKIKRHPRGVGLLSLQSVLFRSGQPEKIFPPSLPYIIGDSISILLGIVL